MTTHIQRAISDVTVEPDRPRDEPADQRWEEQARFERMQRRLERLRQRTRAEGFDD
ncbi:MAG: hypothetical protein J5I93_20800 [Pirellulaceae bacterium]|nr:hypothetical protein [Pirellulaceae bacterium]